MPTKKKRSVKVNRKAARRPSLIVLIIFAILVIPLIIWMYIESRIVNVVFTDVPVRNLPRSFDGTTVLFVSDLHICSYSSPERTFEIMRQLNELKPDLILFGGDYTHSVFFAGSDAEVDRRDRFFAMMGEISAPLGKYGVVGNHDLDLASKTEGSIKNSAAAGGVTMVQNDIVKIVMGGESITIAGLDDWRDGVKDVPGVAGQVSADDCVIVLSHSPDAFPRIISQPAADGGEWADLVLAGHTHGGQVTLFGMKPLMTSSIYGEKYLSGWFRENGTKMLVSNGVGSVFLPLRLCAPAQAHMITLRCE